MDGIIRKIDGEIIASHHYVCESEYRVGLYKAKEIIQTEQKKYKWEECPYGSLIKCPDCQNEFSTIGNCTETFNYCPNCGRKLNQPVEEE